MDKLFIKSSIFECIFIVDTCFSDKSDPKLYPSDLESYEELVLIDLLIIVQLFSFLFFK